jgi:hypothetical protein
MSFLDEGTFVGKGAVKDALKDPEFKALKGDEKANALKTLKMGGSVTTEIEEANAFLAAADAARDKGDKEFEFPKGSGKMHKVTLKRDLDLEEGKLANALGGVALLASLLLMNKINSNDPVVQRLQAEYEQAEPAQQDSIKKLITKRLIFLDSGEFDDTTPMDENAIASFIRGSKFGGPVSDFLDDLADFDIDNDNDLEDNELDLDSPTKKKKFKELDFIEKLSKGKVKEDEYKAILKRLEKMDPKPTDMIKAIKDAYAAGQRTNEAKEEEFDYKAPKDKDNDDIRIDPDTEFKVDLKHLIQKHMKEGKSKEDTIKLTKALMAKLHDKGEVNIDGTKLIFKENKKYADDQLKFKEGDTVYFKNVKGGKNLPMTITGPGKFMKSNRLGAGGKEIVFPVKGGPGGKGMYAADDLVKEADVPQDTQLTLPEPPKRTPNFLGPDNMDYEGGMAKSQMLKMKNYAKALCDMIDDETQLESWVQAKLTKASDYMSSVYHYLDYQRTKNVNEAIGDVIPDGEWQKLDIEWVMDEPDVNRPDYQEGPLYGTTEDGRAFESYGYYTPFEDKYTPLPDEEVVEVPLP